MEPLFGSIQDEEEELDATLHDLLMSPRQFNGLNSIFNPDLNQSSFYDLLPNGSLGSPDFTRQLNSAGLHDTHSSLQHHGLSTTLQLPQPVWPSQEAWLPLSPRCPTLPPLHNGNSFHIDQLLQDTTDLQPVSDSKEPAVLATEQRAAGSGLHHMYPPITPQELKQEQQVDDAAQAQPQLQPLKLSPQQQKQQQQERRRPVSLQPPKAPHLPPGVWLVAPEARGHVAAVVVQQSVPAAVGAAGHIRAAFAATSQQQVESKQQQQQPRAHLRMKRPLKQQQAGGARKAARGMHSSSPSSGSAAAAAASAGGSDGVLTNTSTPGTPTALAAAAAAANQPAAAAAGRRSSSKAPMELGTLVWGKVNRFPWWPAVVVPPSIDEQQQPEAAAAAAAGQQGAAIKPVVFVRFLGTHDSAWLEPGKASPWGVQLSDRSSKTKAAAFVSALREARSYLATGALPEVFKETLPASYEIYLRQQQQQEQSKPVAPKQQSQPAAEGQAASARQQHSGGPAGVNSSSATSSSSLRPVRQRVGRDRPGREAPHTSSSTPTSGGLSAAGAVGDSSAAAPAAAAAGLAGRLGPRTAPQLKLRLSTRSHGPAGGAPATAAAPADRSRPADPVAAAAASVGSGSQPHVRTRSADEQDVRQTRSGKKLRG